MVKYGPTTIHERWASVFKALGHPIRLFIFEALCDSSISVCKLAEMTGVDVSTVSRHLQILSQAGLIRSYKKGTFHYYAVVPGCLTSMIECVRTVGMEEQDNENNDHRNAGPLSGGVEGAR